MNAQRGALEQLLESRIREKKGLDDVAAANRRHSESMTRTAAAYNARAREIRASADAMRAERDASVKLQTEHLNEARTLNELASATELQMGKANKQVAALRRQAAEHRRMADENRRLARSYDDSIKAIDRRARSVERDAAVSTAAARAADKLALAHDRSAASSARSISVVTRQINNLDNSQKKAAVTATRLQSALRRVGLGSGGAASNLRGLNAELQGFAVAATIKYAQSLVSVLAALAAQLLAVAAAAGQAAVGVGAALSAGLAQAIPVAGVLVATFARVAQVLKAVKLENQQQLTASHNAAAAARRQVSAADSIRNAEERVADAHRNSIQAEKDLAQTRRDSAQSEVRAQREVTQARKDAIRTVQDLIRAEEGAVQSVEDAQSALRAAVRGGDVSGAVGAEIGVRNARSDLGRAREDAAPVRAHGVEGVQAVKDAEQRLADVRVANARQVAAAGRQVSDAMRQERRATADLRRTRQAAATDLERETAAIDKLADSLKQLSPAERELYNKILALQAVYKRAARPITDIITRAFSDVVDRITGLLKDPRILSGFRNIAVEIAAAIRQVTAEAGGPKSVSFFELISAEAARNIPIATKIAIDLFRTLRNIVAAALPAFRLLLRYVGDYVKQAKDASENSNGLRDFFVTGVKYAKAFFDLGLAVVKLFLAISGQGGAADSGMKTIEDLTGLVDDLTQKVKDNADKIRDFFAQAHDAFFIVLGVVGTLAREIVSVFSLDSVKSFADFLNKIIIPAIANVVDVMGGLVTVFHQFLSLPGVSQAAQFAATFLLLAKFLTIIRVAILDIIEIVPSFLKAMGLMEVGAEGAAITMTGGIALAILAVIAAIVLLDRKFHFLGPTFTWLKNAATDAFDWIKKAAKDTVDWFSDVWTQGLLYWIRYPFVKAFQWLEKKGVFSTIIGWFKPIVNWFSEDDGTWSQISTLLTAPFEIGLGALKVLFATIKGAVIIFLDVIAGRFDDIGKRISGIWESIFSGIYETTASVVNAMIAGINLAIKAFNAITPGKGSPTISFKMIENYQAKRTLDSAKAGKTPSGSFEGPHAEGGYLPAKPGGRFIQVAEAGHDEVVITTDPRHGDRSRELVNQLLSRAPHLMGQYARGGWVQGAVPTPAGRPITNLAHLLFGRGFNVTSAFRADSNTYHGQGNAIDFGNSANNLRSLWSILFPQRAKFAELFGPTYLASGGLYHGTQQFQDPRLQAGHQDHIHVAMLAGAIKQLLSGANAIGATAALPKILAQSIAKTLGGRPTARSAGIASGALSALYSQGVEKIRDLRTLAGATIDGGTTLQLGNGPAGKKIFEYFRGRGFTDNQAAAWVGNFQQESGLRPNAIQPDGAGRGLAQWGGGRFANLVRFARQRKKPWTDMQTQLDFVWHELQGSESGAYRAIKAATGLEGAVNAIGSRYERYGIKGDRTGPARAALQAYADKYKGGRFAAGGAVPGYGGGDQNPQWLEGGEHVWTKEEVARAGGHGVMRAMRRMMGGGSSSYGPDYRAGGPVKGLPARAPTGTRPRSMWLTIALAPVVSAVTDLLSGVADTMQEVTSKALRNSKKLALRIQRAFTVLTEDGGTLDQLRKSVENIATRAAIRLQRRQFTTGPGGPRRAAFGDAELAQVNLQTLQATGTGLRGERDSIQDGITAANRSIREAQKRKDKKAEAAARAALANLKTRLDDNATLIAQNVQDQVEAVEAYQQALLDGVNNQATNLNNAIDRWSRVARALGQSVDPNAILGRQVDVMRAQIAGLEGVLGQALSTGNINLATQVRDQINELNVQIVEAVAQQFQNSIDAVNNEAQRQSTRADRVARRSQAGGVNYAGLQTSLETRRDIMVTQRAGLQALLNQAAAAGNIEQFNNLADQIDELDTALIENTIAIRDNTDAAFNQDTATINDRFGFSSGVFTGAQAFFQALTARTGIDTLPQQLASLQGLATSLNTQQGGLLSQLQKLTGLDGQGLRGADLVNWLTTISTGPTLQAIMAKLDPTQQQAFRDLVTALIGNATAVEQNTTAINDLTGNNAQSFTSSFWSAFRVAVFNGAGGLLPNYQMTIPGAAVGARVQASGALMVHAGETLRPAVVSRDWDANRGGDTYNLAVTTPTQVLDPTDVNRQLAFLRKTTGR